jgi:hypothetical protein
MFEKVLLSRTLRRILILCPCFTPLAGFEVSTLIKGRGPLQPAATTGKPAPFQAERSTRTGEKLKAKCRVWVVLVSIRRGEWAHSVHFAFSSGAVSSTFDDPDFATASPHTG